MQMTVTLTDAEARALMARTGQATAPEALRAWIDRAAKVKKNPAPAVARKAVAKPAARKAAAKPARKLAKSTLNRPLNAAECAKQSAAVYADMKRRGVKLEAPAWAKRMGLSAEDVWK
jgi:hypothetical protein